jgi:hypothetical protein
MRLLQKVRAAKRGAKREKREAAARDALKEAQAVLQMSPRPSAGRNRASAERGATPSAAASQVRHRPSPAVTWNGPLKKGIHKRMGGAFIENDVLL